MDYLARRLQTEVEDSDDEVTALLDDALLDDEDEDIASVLTSDNHIVDATVQVGEHDADIEEIINRLIDETRKSILENNLADALEISGDPEIIATQKDAVKQLLTQHLYEETNLYSLGGLIDYIQTEVVNAIVGFGPIQGFIDDPSINEIICRYDMPIVIEQNGRLVKTQTRFRSSEHNQMIMDRIAAWCGRHIDIAHPYLDARLPDYSRVHMIIPPLSPFGPVMTIRKFPQSFYHLDRLVGDDRQLTDFLEKLVSKRANILVIGATSSGKTTLARALGFLIPEDENVIVIENSYELALNREMDNVTCLEERLSGLGDRGSVTIRDLVKETLRMRPDRIIVGEVRSAEALDMCDAFATGHEGGMATLHARSIAHGLIQRLPSLIARSGEVDLEQARRMVTDSIDVCIFCGRYKDDDGMIKRNILEIACVAPDEDYFPVPQVIWTKQGGFVGEPAFTLKAKLEGAF